MEPAEPEALTAGEGGGRRLPFPLLFSLQYKPAIAMFGYYQQYHSELAVIFPLGGVLNAACLPWKFSWGTLGFRLGVGYHYWNFVNSDYRISGHYAAPLGSVLYKFPFGGDIFDISLYTGTGMAFMLGYQYTRKGGEKAPTNNSLLFLAGTGALFRWIFWDPVFVMAGAEFDITFGMEDKPTGYIQASIGFGIQIK